MTALKRQSYADFSSSLQQRVNSSRIPVNGTIEVTRRCPLTCQHCYNNLPMNDAAARRDELTTAEHMRIADEIAEAGCFWLLYTGGEIFARSDFLEIYTHAKKQGFLLTLFTNGTLITERIADHLAEWKPFSVEITLYGRTRETYERLTGIPGSYDKCLRGIDLLMERSIPLKLKSVATTITRHELADMKEFARELGLPFMFDPMINPRIDCSQSPVEVRLQPHEVVLLDMQDSDRVKEWKRFAKEFDQPQYVPGREDELYVCGGGINSFAVDPRGMLSICVLSHFDEYDLRKGSFADGWNHFLHSVRRKKRKLPTKCVDCRISSMCGMCPATGELENGDPEKPVEFLCHVAHLRAMMLDVPVPVHGDCDWCSGGAQFDTLLQSAEAARREPPPERPFVFDSPRAASGCGGGCSSCGVANAVH